ncbi:ABC transporter permease [Arthrobacter sp. GCM10027362]|uniref:ABC transporter permease n=1 Tax=Arthrobacter sp. GCM10027362 TaxID=3273379 RepID=UPI00362C44B9
MKLQASPAAAHTGPKPAGAAATAKGARRVPGALVNPVAIVWLITLICLPLSRIVSPNFPSVSLVNSVLILSLFMVTVAFGQGLVILTGGIDLSVASVVGLGAFATGVFANAGVPVLAAVAIAVALSAVVGAVNGLFVAYAGFPPFIVTLASGTILASILLGVSRGAPAQRSPAVLADLFSGRIAVAGIPTPIIVLVLVVLLGLLIQNRTRLGRQAYCVGNSVRATQIAGLSVTATLVSVYVVAAAFYGLTGVMLLGYSSGADLNIGAGWLLPSITAVVVGGSAIRGGAGSFLGTVGGAVLLTLLSICISAAGIPEGFRQVLYGAIILIALIGGRFSQRVS